MRGAAVFMRAQLGDGGQVTIQLVTKKGNFLSPDVKKTWLAGTNELDAIFEAFNTHDMYEVSRVNQ